ncbi:hypothetical protein J2Z19_005247 [Ensifer adhaerens]|uniref:Uncharacterized protein n=1 Tax=Ensifer adhaerens TaxID=106592 RepID=A0ACC5T2Z5_ENSAD|nr:hypothetical protein [Ensifer adhaerens]
MAADECKAFAKLQYQGALVFDEALLKFVLGHRWAESEKIEA